MSRGKTRRKCGWQRCETRLLFFTSLNLHYPTLGISLEAGYRWGSAVCVGRNLPLTTGYSALIFTQTLVKDTTDLRFNSLTNPGTFFETYWNPSCPLSLTDADHISSFFSAHCRKRKISKHSVLCRVQPTACEVNLRLYVKNGPSLNLSIQQRQVIT